MHTGKGLMLSLERGQFHSQNSRFRASNALLVRGACFQIVVFLIPVQQCEIVKLHHVSQYSVDHAAPCQQFYVHMGLIPRRFLAQVNSSYKTTNVLTTTRRKSATSSYALILALCRSAFYR
jgi:hypothetical protein